MLTYLILNETQFRDSDNSVLNLSNTLVQNSELTTLILNSDNISNIAFSKEAIILESAPSGKIDFTNQNALTNLTEQNSLDITGEVRTIDQED